jgi:diguanylate cyclase (GGDEF)-like protein/PAS domain S-box-containing protein
VTSRARSRAEFTGREPGELIDEFLATLTVNEERAEQFENIQRLLDGDLDNYRGEMRMIDASGHAVATALHATVVRDPAGNPEHLLLQVQDNTDRKRFEDQMQFMADHDPLTGLLNRRAFERELASHVGRVARYGAHGALLAMDLDHFKVINDSLGHHAGDELITRITGLLRESLRDSDVLARLGGDEFAVLLRYATPEQAAAAAAIASASTTPTATRSLTRAPASAGSSGSAPRFTRIASVCTRSRSSRSTRTAPRCTKCCCAWSVRTAS